MTVDTYAGGTLAGYADPELEDSGLEDLSSDDIRVPRLKIVGKNATFKDTLTNQEYPVLNTIILGLTKQRIMWRKDVDEDEKPLCKSPDFGTGFPTVEGAPPDKLFPWADSGFDPNVFNHYSEDPANNGHVALPCANCRFKEWGSNKQPPACAESFAYAILYGEPGEEPTSPAILTLQRSAISAAKTYNAFFAAQKVPFFQFYTEMSLVQRSRGSVEYATPVLKRGAQTDQGMWSFFAGQARSIRDHLRQPPRPPEGWTPAELSGNVNEAPVAPVTAPAAPAPAPAPTPAPAPAPTPAPAPPKAAVAPPAPPAPAVPKAAPAAPPAPPAAAPAAPAPAASAAQADDDDDLPF